jgi:two-component system, chemotaxis family, sensor kinase CheA
MSQEIQLDRALLAESFVAEAAELLEKTEQLLLVLEGSPEDDETLHALFRAAHTIKGSSSIVGFDEVTSVAHAAEELLERVRAKALRATPAVVTLLLQTVDVLREAVAAAAAGRPAPASVDAVRAELARAAEGGAEEATATVSPAQPSPEGTRAAARTLRVDVSRLDRMLDLAGEIGISRGRLADMLERRGGESADAFLEAHRDADRLYHDLQELILQARMVPLGPSFRQHLRAVRDLAAAAGKQVRLVLEGEDVEVDTAVVEGLRDPLTHLVRNAVDHGLELPAPREARGKDPCGRLVLRAFHEAGLVVIEVSDDGAGLDRERILQRAVETRLVAEGASLSDEDVLGLVFEPGFSTRDAVSEVSGRGVGLDVVRRNVAALRGSIAVASAPGRGTTVTLRVPLTLAIIDGFRVSVGNEVYILPLETVAECLELPAGTPAGSTGVLEVRGKPLPFLRLRDHFDTRSPSVLSPSKDAPPARENVVVVQHAGTRVGLAVDGLLGDGQTVIKPLGRLFWRVRGLAGSAILGDGRVALILDVPGLLRETQRRGAAQTPLDPSHVVSEKEQLP